MDGRADLVIRLLLKVAVAAWLVRWAAMELAAYSGRYWQALGPAPRDSARAPGRMPGPGD